MPGSFPLDCNWRRRRHSRSQPAATQGPFRVELLFQDGQTAPEGHVTYSIRVRGSDGEHVVHRRYSDFALLHQDLRVDLGENSRLPDLPRKSTFRKRFFLTGPRFMEHREKGLRQVLKAAVSADGWAECPCLRAFLGLRIEGGRSLLGWDDTHHESVSSLGHLGRSLGPLCEGEEVHLSARFEAARQAAKQSRGIDRSYDSATLSSVLSTDAHSDAEPHSWGTTKEPHFEGLPSKTRHDSLDSLESLEPT